MRLVSQKILLAWLIGASSLFGFSELAFSALSVENTSNYKGGGRWDWSIYIDTDPQTLQTIRCVEYTLHPTFTNPVRKICDAQDTKFALSTNGWGTFRVKVEIHYKDQKIHRLEHQLFFEKPPPTPSLQITAKNWSKEIGERWWEWGVYIEGSEAELGKIRCVEYTLHRTFRNPIRKVCSRDNHFLLTTKGWGTFAIPIIVFLKDGSTYRLTHQLRFE